MDKGRHTSGGRVSVIAQRFGKDEDFLPDELSISIFVFPKSLGEFNSFMKRPDEIGGGQRLELCHLDLRIEKELP